MKKLLALILAISILFTFAACSSKISETEIDDALVDTQEPDSSASSDAQDDEELMQDEENINNSGDKTSTTQKPDEEKSEDQTPSSTPSEKPEQQPTPQPQNPSEVKPSPEPEAPVASTLGNTLLKDFNAKAGSGMSALSIAEALVTSPSIAFSGGAMPVEEGLLSGFDNYEVKGFKSGAMFAPMIGSIPFVGYIFELNNSQDASSFISNLRNNANLRWNICSEAEEMITGSKGNMVFFVMCPKSMEE